MKLDRPGAPRNQPLAPEEWTMEVSRDGSMLVATIRREHEDMCRVSITASAISEDEQHTMLADKARAWIADYLARPHSGNTQPAVL